MTPVPRARLALLLCALPTLFPETVRPQEGTEYFAGFTFWESPVQPFRFEGPLTADEAAHRVHVRVDYDGAGCPVEVSFRLGDRVKDIEGRGAGNIYVHAPITRVRCFADREEHTFFDRFGEPIDGWGVHRKVYRKDEFGRYTRLEFRDATGRTVENAWGIAAYEWRYAGDGSVLETRHDATGRLLPHRPGFEFLRTRLRFGPRGHLTSLENIDEEGRPIASASGAAQYRYVYGPMGEFARWEVYGPDGRPTVGPTGTGGEVNRYVGTEHRSIVFFGPDREPTLHASGAASWQMRYDGYGNVIEAFYTDLDGAPSVASRYGVARSRYRYGEDGLFLLGIEHVDLDGRPAVHARDGYASLRIERDEAGRVTDRVRLDADGRRLDGG